MLVADRLSSDRSVAKPDDEGKDDEGDGKEDEGFGHEAKEKSLEESKHSTDDAYPATFLDLCVQMTERAHFLLEVRTGMHCRYSYLLPRLETGESSIWGQ